MELINSKRLLYTASYVTTKLTPEDQKKAQAQAGKEAAAFTKVNVLRAIDLKPENFNPLLDAINADDAPQHRNNLEKLLFIAKRLNDTVRPVTNIELAPMIAPIPFSSINHFANLAAPVQANISMRLPLIAFFVEQSQKILPIGRIHLERIEMYPAGVEKGELVFSVPMAPGETTTISHKEWTTTTRGFEDIVQDYFESYSERGVAEKTDASMSNESETKHSNAFDFGSSLTGTYTGVTLTTTVGFKTTNDERESAKNSMQKNREVTEKASARTRKEHKVSMKLETKTGTEDVSGKTITNTANTAVRIDYYRMMRKWRTDLYRYGLRQTYDIAIPMPGVRFWALHQHLAELDKQLREPVNFLTKPEDINRFNYRQEALKWGTTVQDPPDDSIREVKYGRIDFLSAPDSKQARFSQMDIDVPAGYYIDLTPTLTAHIAPWPDEWQGFWVIDGVQEPMTAPPDEVITAKLPALFTQTGHRSVIYKYAGVSAASIEIALNYKLTSDATTKWQYAVWSQLLAAATARHQEELARKQDERDRLSRLLNGKDTLTLRRLEREELLRLVMQWLLGPGHPLISNTTVEKTVKQLLQNERDFQGFTGGDPLSPTFTSIAEKAWFDSVTFGEQVVKFIHQAVEWENILYFLYPYFWGSETVGRDKMLFEHPDPEHESFLRAGYVRIVLPVRPGFEADFTDMIEKGSLADHETHPYIDIATEIQNFSRTNYSGIPPANPELHARPLLYPEQRATWDVMQKLMEAIDKIKKDSGSYPSLLSAVPGGPYLDAWGNEFIYRLPGLGADYDLVSLGADNKEGGEGLNADISSAAGASLIATWFDYTPTSALDIEVDTKPEDIA